MLDLVGGETQICSFQVLRPGGKLISTVSQPDQERAKHHGVSAAFFLVDVTTERLRKIAELIDRGELKTHVSAVFPLTYARDAHMMLEGRWPPPRGKIILNVKAAGEVTSRCAVVDRVTVQRLIATFQAWPHLAKIGVLLCAQHVSTMF